MIERLTLTHEMHAELDHEVGCRKGLLEELGVTALTADNLSPGPALQQLRTAVLQEVLSGSGLVLLDRIPVERLSPLEVEAWTWVIGLLLGEASSQSGRGDRLGHVEASSEVAPGERGYRTRDALGFHTDSDDVVVCVCVRPAPTGGVSRFASAAAVYSAVCATDPAAAAILRRGFRYHLRGEGPSDEPPVTDYHVPVFAIEGERVCCVYLRDQIEMAATEPGIAPLSSEEVGALDLLDRSAHLPSVLVEHTLAAGEAYVLNNWTTLHSRTKYEDSPGAGNRRLLHRLWLRVDHDERPSAQQRRFYGVGGIAQISTNVSTTFVGPSGPAPS